MKNNIFDNEFDGFFYMKYPEFKELYAAKLFNLRNAFSTIISNLSRYANNTNFCKKSKICKYK